MPLNISLTSFTDPAAPREHPADHHAVRVGPRAERSAHHDERRRAAGPAQGSRSLQAAASPCAVHAAGPPRPGSPLPRARTPRPRRLPSSPCSVFHECLETGAAAAPRRLDFGGIEVDSPSTPPDFCLSPAAAVFKPQAVSSFFTLRAAESHPDSRSELAGLPVEFDLSGTSSVSLDGEEAKETCSEIWGTFLEALNSAWLGTSEECLESKGGALEVIHEEPEPSPPWLEHLLEDPEPCPSRSAEAPAECKVHEAHGTPEIPEIKEVPLARDVPQVVGPCGDIVGGWFQSVDDIFSRSDEAGDIHITEDELSPMTRASLCDLVD